MFSSQKMTIIPKDEQALKVSKKQKNKKKKKEKKDKGKGRFVPNFLLHDDYSEMAFTQTQEVKKRKKAKKKTKPSKDFQQPKLKKHHKQLKDNQQTPIIYISSDQETQQSVENHHRSIKGKVKKRVIFNLPPEYNQDKNTNDEELENKLFVGESSLESNTAEEMNSQDMFITQKSFLDPYADISSSSSGSEGATMKMNHSCKSTTEATTQTENFFTFPAISTSFRIRQQQNESTCEEAPMDLSLPNRTRGSRHRMADSAHPPKLKISDTSSEEGETLSKPKGDLLQLKVIQTRLNESFFFKMKGEDSPKPVSPLMKLTQSVEKKTKK